VAYSDIVLYWQKVNVFQSGISQNFSEILVPILKRDPNSIIGKINTSLSLAEFRSLVQVVRGLHTSPTSQKGADFGIVCSQSLVSATSFCKNN